MMTDPTSEQSYFEPSAEGGDDAVQEPEATGLPSYPRAGDRAPVGVRVGEGNAGGYFGVKTEEEANEALAYFASYCKNCQYEEACPGSSCAIYRAEEEAVSVLRGTPVLHGVPIRQDIT